MQLCVSRVSKREQERTKGNDNPKRSGNIFLDRRRVHWIRRRESIRISNIYGACVVGATSDPTRKRRHRGVEGRTNKCALVSDTRSSWVDARSTTHFDLHQNEAPRRRRAVGKNAFQRVAQPRLLPSFPVSLHLSRRVLYTRVPWSLLGVPVLLIGAERPVVRLR